MQASLHAIVRIESAPGSIMGVAYSQDLRERVMAAVDGGLGVYSAAPMFRVSVSYIYKALGRRRATGDVTAHKSGGGPKPKLAAYDEALRAQVTRKTDITLVELQTWLANDHAVKVSVGCLWARLRDLGLTLKKVATRRRAGPRRHSGARQQWPAQQDEWPDNLVFVDETGASTKMTRLYGRCPRGERLVAPVPWGHWKTTTFVGALRQDGLVAPCAFDGPINGETFRAWVEPATSSSWTICRATRSKASERRSRTPGPVCVTCRPCSPDLNLIEQWFAKLKALLRKAAARTFDALIQAIASALETFTPNECANYLANSGYRRQ
jgi:transposase